MKEAYPSKERKKIYCEFCNGPLKWNGKIYWVPQIKDFAMEFECPKCKNKIIIKENKSGEIKKFIINKDGYIEELRSDLNIKNKMIEKVIKKSGQKEDYDENKIKNSIKKACEEAGIPEDRAEEIVNIVLDHINNVFKERDEVNSSEIREVILGKLDEIEPSVSDAWRNYEETQK